MANPAFPTTKANPNPPQNPGYNLYVGARYVPVFSDKNNGQWTNTIEYEPLTIVLYNGDSYTSRTFVPIGIDITNTTYWALTGAFNAQYEQLLLKVNANTTEIDSLDARVETVEDTLSTNMPYIATPQIYGAKGDGVTDDTQALKLCFANHDCVHIPAGTYLVTDTIQITRTGQYIWGDGNESYVGNNWSGSTIISNMNKPTIEVMRTAWNTTLENFGLWCTGTANPGGDGFLIHNWTLHNRFISLRAQNFNNGFTIGATSQGYFSFCSANNNFQDGFYFSNVVDDYQYGNSLQWDFLDCFAQTNNRHGCYYFNGQTNTCPIGSIINFNTFANGGAGLKINDTTATQNITAIRISNSFLGNDGQGGIVITKTSYTTTINNCQFEAAGTGGTGRDRQIPESHSAYNIQINEGATRVIINSCMIATGSIGGVYINSAGVCVISNNDFYTNGLYGNESTAAQIVAGSSTQYLTINGNMFTGGKYGMHIPYGGYNIITSNYFRSLSDGNFTPSSGSTNFMQIANNLDKP